MTLEEAYEIVKTHSVGGLSVGREGARETRDGWFFPWEAREPTAGSNGLIVDKQTRAVVYLGSKFSVERDICAYDAGYRFGNAGLIVTAVFDVERTVELLQKIGIQNIVPEEAHGVVWRIPRPFSVPEIRLRLAALPSDFGTIPVYFAVEYLETAKREGCFAFELIATP